VTWFSDLTEFVALPRVTSLCLSPDGTWLAAAVQTVGPEPKKFGTSIWRIDTGQARAVRLTRSAEGESVPAFLPDGSLLFVSKPRSVCCPPRAAWPAGSGRPLAAWSRSSRRAPRTAT
jgi:hypothetical protein